MSYTPSLADLDEMENHSLDNAKSSYEPSLGDLDDETVDTFLGKMPVPSKDFDENARALGLGHLSAEQRANRLKGMAQGAENFGIGTANLLPSVNIPRANWAGNNEDVKRGELGSELVSYFTPGAALKAARAIPIIGNALKATVRGMEHRPLINSLAQLTKGAGEGAFFGAVNAKDDDKGHEAKKGAEVGLGANMLAQLARLKNPFVNAILRAGVGGGAGYLSSDEHPYKTAAEGAGIGIGLPYAAKAVGIGNKPAGLETLNHLLPNDVSASFNAGNRLNTPITPSEASGNPFVGKIEGSYGRTGEAAAEKTRIGLDRVGKQQSAINDLMDTIYDKSTPEAALSSKKKIQDLYASANRWNLKPDVIDNFKDDPVIYEAFKKVKSDPAYQRKLANIPENNYAYLNQVKRALSDMEGSAINAGEKDRATEFGEARKQLVTTMDNQVPDYKKAREEAQKSIVRSQIQKSLNKKEVTGSHFYNAFLANENKFKELHNSLRNIPEAQDKLNDMKLAWKNLINLEKPRSSSYRTESGLDQSRNWASKLIDQYNEITGAKRNIKALKFIHSPEWDKGFEKIQEIKDYSKRKDALANFVGQLTSANIISQGSDNGDNL